MPQQFWKSDRIDPEERVVWRSEDILIPGPESKGIEPHRADGDAWKHQFGLRVTFSGSLHEATLPLSRVNNTQFLP